MGKKYVSQHVFKVFLGEMTFFLLIFLAGMKKNAYLCGRLYTK